jgi:hypothetical protein
MGNEIGCCCSREKLPINANLPKNLMGTPKSEHASQKKFDISTPELNQLKQSAD